MTRESLLAIVQRSIIEELGRQHETMQGGPYTYNELGDEIGVDGVVNTRELAAAVLSAIREPVSRSMMLTADDDVDDFRAIFDDLVTGGE